MALRNKKCIIVYIFVRSPEMVRPYRKCIVDWKPRFPLPGLVSDGYEGTVYQSGNDLLLDVMAISGPSTKRLAMFGLWTTLFLRRRQQ